MQSHEKNLPLSQLALKLDFFQEDIWLRAKKGIKKAFNHSKNPI